MGEVKPAISPASTGVRHTVPAKLENRTIGSASVELTRGELGFGSAQLDHTNKLQNFIISAVIGNGGGSIGATIKTSIYKNNPGFNQLSQAEQRRVILKHAAGLSPDDTKKLIEQYKKENPTFVSDTSTKNINMLRFYLSAAAGVNPKGIEAENTRLLVSPDGKNIIAVMSTERAQAASVGVGVKLGAEYGTRNVAGMTGFGAFAEVGVFANFGKNPLNGDPVGNVDVKPSAGIEYNIGIGRNGSAGGFIEANPDEVKGGVRIRGSW